MKPIHKRPIIDNLQKHFEKGGKLSVFHAAYDSIVTVFFVPKRTTNKGAHIRDNFDMKRGMISVVYALIPALLFGMFNIGVQHYISITPEFATWKTIIPHIGFFPILLYGFLKMLPLLLITYGVGLPIEILFAQIKKEEVNEGYFVTAMLIALIVPPDIPLWQLITAIVFAVIIGKEAFGGSGMNIMNPALLARAFLFFSYPKQMSGDNVWIAEKLDAFSGATPLAHAAKGAVGDLPSNLDMILGFIPGSIGETSVIAISIGAIFLLLNGIASWKIMFSTIFGGLLMGVIFNLWGANAYMEIPAYQHLFMGGFLFGAVFMATDPVTATQTEKGKYIYGLLIGILAVGLRVLNPAYPEQMMLAILFMNIMAPLIDHIIVNKHIKKRTKRWALNSNNN